MACGLYYILVIGNKTTLKTISSSRTLSSYNTLILYINLCSANSLNLPPHFYSQQYNKKQDNKQLYVRMSRQEIQRILNSDMTQIDQSINKRLKAIDSITSKVSGDSIFLVEFQQMLMKQLEKQEEYDRLTGRREEQEVVKRVEFVGEKDIGAEDRSERQEDVRKEIKEDVKEDIIGEVEQFVAQPQKISQSTQTQHNKKIISAVRTIKESLGQLSHFNTELSSLLIQLLTQQKQTILETVSQSIETILAKTHAVHSKEVQSLKAQNRALKKQIADLAEQLHTKENEKQRQPLKQLIIEANQPYPSTNRKQKPYSQLQIDFQLTPSICLDPQPSLSLPRVPQHPQRVPSLVSNSKDESFEFFRNQPQEQIQITARYEVNPYNREERIAVPQIKGLRIGVPPVRNGFGVLKSGPTVIYKGMWSDGKFEGKGKLTFGSYSYEGDFRKGLFDGYGKLQIGSVCFMGKFQGNRVQGQGTYSDGQREIHGYWNDNVLVHRY